MSISIHYEVVYYVAKILKKSADMTIDAIYSIHSSGSSKAKWEDVILALIPGFPLLII